MKEMEVIVAENLSSDRANAQAIIRQDIDIQKASFKDFTHDEVIVKLMSQIGEVDFRQIIGLEKNVKISRNHYLVSAVNEFLRVTEQNNWGLCKKNNATYLFNGKFWKLLDKEELQYILGEAAGKMGIDKFVVQLYSFKEELLRQFMSKASLPSPKGNGKAVLVNLLNGTFEITPERQIKRDFCKDDFLTYQLPFAYDETATCPMFIKFLDKVLPDKTVQQVLAEYLGAIFIPSTTLKLEKALLLYGTGANGKSVIFDIVTALFGAENISNYSLQNLTADSGYYRAKIGNKLLNYATEISGKLESSMFKQMTSGEPIEARLPYGEPIILRNYAKLMFNCNQLPSNVEQTPAFFRRLLPIPFDVTIPESEQDRELSKKIIAVELPGIFNWVISGLRRVLKQKNFSYSEAIDNQLRKYKTESDSLEAFLEDAEYHKSACTTVDLKVIYPEYRNYCKDNGFIPIFRDQFTSGLKSRGFAMGRRAKGWVVYAEKIVSNLTTPTTQDA